MQKKKITVIILTVLLLVFATLLWWATNQIAQAYSVGMLILELISLSLAYIFLQLISLFVQRVFFIECIAVCAFAVSIVFAPHLWHTVFVAFASLLLLRGLSMIRKDMRLNVKISLWKSLHLGKNLLLFAFALVLSSQYFFAAANHSGDALIPGLEVGKIGSKLVLEAVSYINPQYQTLKEETLTVDDFLLQSYNQRQDEYAGLDIESFVSMQSDIQSLPPEQQEIMKDELKKRISNINRSTADLQKELALEGGRMELAKFAGREVSGSEKISQVFSSAIESKINEFFAPNAEMPQRAKAYQFIVAIVFFLSIFSTGSLFWWPWTLLAVGIFRFCVRLKAISIGKIPVEMEIIE